MPPGGVIQGSSAGIEPARQWTNRKTKNYLAANNHDGNRKTGQVMGVMIELDGIIF